MVRLLKADELYIKYLLDGGVIGIPAPMGGYPNLVGKAITFTTPVFTHTFVDGAGGNGFLTLADIGTQLSVASGGALRVGAIGGSPVFYENSPTTGVALNAAAEEAKSIMGFRPSQAGEVIWPAGSGLTPQLMHMFQSQDGNLGCVISDSAVLVTAPSASSTPVAAGKVGSIALAGGGKLWELNATNIGGADKWFLIFDKATDPVNGNVPKLMFWVPDGATLSEKWLHGMTFVNGIAWASSTTPAVLTLSATNDFWPVLSYSN